jgi:hypothetical protein
MDYRIVGSPWSSMLTSRHLRERRIVQRGAQSDHPDRERPNSPKLPRHERQSPDSNLLHVGYRWRRQVAKVRGSKQLLPTFEKLDKNGDGILERAEVPK